MGDSNEHCLATPSVVSDSGDIPTPPSAPNPAGDAGVLPEFHPVSLDNIPSPPPDFDWDIKGMEADTAMRLIFTAVHDLAIANGEVPPTPAIARPQTPSKYAAVIQAAHERHRHHRRTSSRPATPIPQERIVVDADPIDPPEASSDEPITTNTGQIGTEYEPSAEEIANLARKFFSKHVPSVTLEKYSIRMQSYCPMTTSVWLGAGAYIYRMCCLDRRVPLTARTMHRVLLASLVTAMKALEDHRWPHGRFAKVGGVEARSLTRIELAVIYLTGGHLQFLHADRLRDAVVGLQKAARDATQANQLAATFNLALPTPRNSVE